MAKKQKGAPARARALKRYGEMEAPGAYFVLHEEWLPAIACILDPSLSVWPVPPIFAAVEVIAASWPFEQN
jgi:hypothetical protein